MAMRMKELAEERALSTAFRIRQYLFRPAEFVGFITAGLTYTKSSEGIP
jgi:hypothetical protein